MIFHHMMAGGLFMLMAMEVSAEANFEDTRCRCVCPNTRYFAGDSSNQTENEDNHRRYYTMTNINPAICNPVSVVKKEVAYLIDEVHIDAFLANCDCRHESRNTVMLKVAIIFVMCLLALLVIYMSFLMCLDPVLRKHSFASSPFAYRAHNDEMEANIFASNASPANAGEVEGSSQESIVSTSDALRSRSVPVNNVLERVEAEQNKWMKKVEEQRKNIFTDHTMLN